MAPFDMADSHNTFKVVACERKNLNDECQLSQKAHVGILGYSDWQADLPEKLSKFLAKSVFCRFFAGELADGTGQLPSG
ncbi:hypothetical protein [Rubinisphaera sp. JC750]|uniref:hypothetical protein n=1 Tax=Rubinisphaera sp. JC750 TaxID=2898658 RepID=UPI001F24ACFE|nr:hypothetical protein [Rubinisphaera sp. JC750]